MTRKELTKLWEEKFDHIYLQHYPKYKDRFESIMNELKRVGILDASNFTVYYSIPNNLEDKIYKYYHDNHLLQNQNITLNIFRCGYTFYRILNEAVFMNQQRTLILHDDIRFLNNLQLIYDIISNIPEDYDVCLFDYLNCFIPDENHPGLTIDNYKEPYPGALIKYNKYYYSHPCLFGNTIGAYSNRYMKVMIDANEYRFGHTDSYITNELSGYTILKDVGYDFFDYNVIFSYPRLALQIEYNNSLAMEFFNEDYTKNNQYNSRPCNFLNHDIDYSKYNYKK